MITRGEFFMIKEMYERGMSISDIARELGIDRKTVRKYIHSPNPLSTMAFFFLLPRNVWQKHPPANENP
ncbi:putative transposase [Geobacillus sp. GHH01]|nr:putative transposase [Geobacillus sp. GHH01]